MTEPASVFLIADDHSIFRQGLCLVLERFDPAATVVEADSFDGALALAPSTTPSLIVADLRMPSNHGFAGLRRLRQAWPTTPILALSASEEADDVIGSLEAGASGYLCKSAPTAQLLDVIRLVMLGGIYVPRDLLDGFEAQPAAHALPALTHRQQEVLGILATGCSNKEIARRLGTSQGTIKAHVSAVMRAFGVNNRVRLLVASRELNERPR